MKIPVNTRILALMGDISATFSNLEAQMGSLLAQLIDTSDQSIVGLFLADDFSLSRTTELVRRFSRYRFVHADDTIHRIACLCNSVDEVRILRNQFAHGMWNFDPKILAQGKISVWDMRWKEDKKSKHWSRGDVHIYTEKELIEIRNRIGQLVHVALALNHEITPSQLMPHWQANKSADPSVG